MAIFDLDGERTKKLKGFASPDQQKQHRRALDGFKASASFFAEQRRRELADLKFVDFDEEWDPTAKTQRAGSQSTQGLPPTPPRPMLTINQLLAPCEQLANTRRQARLGLQFSPKGPGARQDVAEIYEDLARAMQAESGAAVARNWAADRAEKAGLGWYRIDTEYSQETPDVASWNDQDIVWSRILNQASVYPDPHAQQADFSDGRRLYVTEDLPIAVYRERFPDSDLAAYDNSELSGIGDPIGKWIFTSNADDGTDTQIVRIAECYEVKEETKILVALTDGTAAFEDNIPNGKIAAIGPQARKRKKTTRRVYWSLINGVEYLEEPREINCEYIPVIPCVGKEANVDGERRWRGLVRPGKDAAVSYNVMRSAQVEAIALASKAPYIGYARVFGQYLEWWKQGPSRNFPFLPIEEAYDRQGNLLPPPQRNVAEPAIQAITIAAGAAQADVHTTTGIPPVALGQLDPHDRSGTAIKALQGQAEVGSSGYMDNFVSITLAYEGKVVRSYIKHVFDRPGRIVAAVGVDEKRRLVMLNAPFVYTPDGMPVMVPGWEVGQPVPTEFRPPNAQPDAQPIPVEYYDLSAGDYTVAPVVDKFYQTRRQETAAAISNALEVLQGTPMGMALVPAWLEAQDTPDARKLAEIAKAVLPPEVAHAYEDETGGGDPAMQAQVQALTQQLQQLQQQLQSKVAEKQAEVQAKGQVDLQKTQMQESAATQRTEISAAASMANAQAKIDAENFRSYVDALETKLAKQLDFHMSRLSDAIQKTHETNQQALKHAHEAGLAALQHAHTLQQTQQAADLAPEPVAPGAE